MLKSSLRDQSNASGTITVSEAGAEDAVTASYRNNMQQILKHFEPLIECIAEINNRRNFGELSKCLTIEIKLIPTWSENCLASKVIEKHILQKQIQNFMFLL